MPASITSIGLLLFSAVILIPSVTYLATLLRYRYELQEAQKHGSLPQQPVKLPYALPFLGHALDFLSFQPGSFWTKLMQRHPRSTGACSLLLGGTPTQVLFNPHAVQGLFKVRDATRNKIDFDLAIKGFGLDTDEAFKYYGYENEVLDDTDRSPKDELYRLDHEYLLRNKEAGELTSIFTDLFREKLRSEPEAGVAEVNLTFSPAFFGLPRFLARKAYDARDEAIAGLELWNRRNHERTNGEIADPDEPTTRWDPVNGSRWNRARQIYLAERGMGFRARASIGLGVLFGISSNAIPTSGWMLLHILDPKANSTLYPRIMAEVQECRQPDGTPDISKLITQPLLNSTFHETLRFYMDVFITRQLPHDAILPLTQDGKTKMLLRKDDTIMAPTWLAHRDESFWQAPGPDIFHAERFLRTDPSTGQHTYSTDGMAGKLFPFGGGRNMCPGRVFAKQEALATVAMVLLEFEFEVLGFVDRNGKVGQQFPGLKDVYPGSAVMVPDGDLRVKMTARR